MTTTRRANEIMPGVLEDYESGQKGGRKFYQFNPQKMSEPIRLVKDLDDPLAKGFALGTVVLSREDNRLYRTSMQDGFRSWQSL